MSHTYKVAEGHNIALVSLITISPQPKSPGIKPVQRQHAVSGATADDGEYVDLIFTALADAAEYQALLAQFGLDTAKYANVTVYVRDDQWASIRKNGIAHRPELGKDGSWENYFPRNIVITITDLETSS